MPLTNLAFLYSKQGRYSDAEPLYKRALAINEKGLGPDHPAVALSLSNLAALYNDQGRYAEAEPLYKRALAISEKHSVPIIQCCPIADQSGYFRRNQARYAEAEPLYKRSLEYRESFGPNHPDVAVSLNNLAGLYRAQGRYADALPWKRTISQNTAKKAIAFPILYGSDNPKTHFSEEALNASYAVLQRSISTAAGKAISRLGLGSRRALTNSPSSCARIRT